MTQSSVVVYGFDRIYFEIHSQNYKSTNYFWYRLNVNGKISFGITSIQVCKHSSKQGQTICWTITGPTVQWPKNEKKLPKIFAVLKLI